MENNEDFDKLDELLEEFADSQEDIDLTELRRELLNNISSEETVTKTNLRRYKRQILGINWSPTMSLVASVVISLFLGVGGFAQAADNSHPGQLLYGMDQAMEQVQEQLTRSDEGKLALQTQITEERLEELRQLEEEKQETEDEEEQDEIEDQQDELVESLKAQSDRLLDKAEEFRDKAEGKDSEKASEALNRVADRLEAHGRARAEASSEIDAGAEPGEIGRKLRELNADFNERAEGVARGLRERAERPEQAEEEQEDTDEESEAEDVDEDEENEDNEDRNDRPDLEDKLPGNVPGNPGNAGSQNVGDDISAESEAEGEAEGDVNLDPGNIEEELEEKKPDDEIQPAYLDDDCEVTNHPGHYNPDCKGRWAPDKLQLSDIE